jgi:hypothetical protein
MLSLTARVSPHRSSCQCCQQMLAKCWEPCCSRASHRGLFTCRCPQHNGSPHLRPCQPQGTPVSYVPLPHLECAQATCHGVHAVVQPAEPKVSHPHHVVLVNQQVATLQVPAGQQINHTLVDAMKKMP